MKIKKRLFSALGLVFTAALAGSSGCSRIHEPRVNDPVVYAAPVPSELATLTDECPEMGLPEGHKDQYAGLRTLIAQMAEGYSDRRLLDAHTVALRKTIAWVRGVLASRKEGDVKRRLREFSRFIARQIRPTIPRETFEHADNDVTMMFRGLQIREGSTCGNIYMNLFLTTYLRELDAFARLDVEVPDGEPYPLGELLLPPAGDLGAPRLSEPEDREGLAVLTLRRWERSEAMQKSLKQLEADAASGKVKRLLIDLRLAAGSESAALREMREAFAADKAAGRLPTVIWIDGLTRGAPEALVSELKTREEVLVAGEKSFGSGRLPCQRTQILAPGTPGLTLSMGCERIGDGGGVLPAVRVPVFSDGLSERRRLSEAGIPVTLRPAPVTSEPAPIEPGPVGERLAKIRNLVPLDRPGTLEIMAGVAEVWGE